MSNKSYNKFRKSEFEDDYDYDHSRSKADKKKNRQIERELKIKNVDFASDANSYSGARIANVRIHK